MTEHRLGDAPIEPQYREKMQALAMALDQIFNDDLKGADRKVGFVMMVYNFADGADRKDVVVLMKEMVARFEASRK